jgi:hypothetical protein
MTGQSNAGKMGTYLIDLRAFHDFLFPFNALASNSGCGDISFCVMKKPLGCESLGAFFLLQTYRIKWAIMLPITTTCSMLFLIRFKCHGSTKIDAQPLHALT